MKSSRRKFLKILAAGSAALATRPAAALAANPPAPAPKAPAAAPAHAAAASPAEPGSSALRAGIERQQHDLAKTLKTIRDYPLAPGAEPAFVLTPIRARRAGKTS